MSIDIILIFILYLIMYVVHTFFNAILAYFPVIYDFNSYYIEYIILDWAFVFWGFGWAL